MTAPSVLVTPEMLAAIQQRRLEDAKLDAQRNVFETDDNAAKNRRVQRMSLSEYGQILRFAVHYLDGRFEQPDVRNFGGALLRRGIGLVFELGDSSLRGKTSRMHSDIIFGDYLKEVGQIFDEALEASTTGLAVKIAQDIEREMGLAHELALNTAESALADASAERQRADETARQAAAQKRVLEFDHAAALKVEIKRREHLEAEAPLLRQRVLDTERELAALRTHAATLETELATARTSLLGMALTVQPTPAVKETPMPVSVKITVDTPLEGMAFAVHLRAAGHDARFDPDTRQVSCSRSPGGMQAQFDLLLQRGDLRVYLREHLRAAGLLAPS